MQACKRVEYSEADLIKRTTNGDAQAFAQLYDAYVQKLYRYVYFRTHHKETAEDLTSLIFLKAFEEMKSFNAAKGNFSAWIYRIAHNAVIDHYRARKSAEPIEDVWDALRDHQDLPRDLDVKAKLRDIEKHLSALPATQREILILRIWDGYSYKEIAEMTGKTEAACKMTASRALKVLRETVPLLLFLSLLIPPRL